ncbi:MAG: GH92 family glycosyl hydrolase [Ignavibacteriaceae bacterium]
MLWINRLFILILLSQFSILPQSFLENKALTNYVNPFIGTSNGGNTFPGAVVPWGMVSVSPHNSLNAVTGYLYGEKDFYGFGMVHLSGVGCPELGSIMITMADKKSVTSAADFKCSYSNEIAEPGFYSVKLDDQHIIAEMTATERVGILKFKSNSNSEKSVVVDVGRSLGIVGGGKIKIVSDNEIEGYNISGGFCGEANSEEVYFSAKFNKKFEQHKIWVNDNLISDNEAQVVDSSIGTVLNFNLNEDEELIIKVGISYVSSENAKLNLETEIPDWDFDRVKEEAQIKWEKQLSRIIVEDSNDENLIKFYTAIYHTLIHPNIISDVNGEYPLMGRSGIGQYFDRNRYSVFSLWDTYRTLHPFLTLIYPEVQSEMIKTMIDMYKESGYLPKWELAGIETYMMVGDPASIVIADSYVKGITDFDMETAFDAMLKPAMLQQNEKAPPIRAGYHELLQYGYIPFEQDWSFDWWVWGPVSTTLEYCLSDFAISQMSRKLGNSELADEFYNRSLLYKNLFDSNTKLIRPKMKNGDWMEPFDEFAIDGSGDWVWAGGPGYVEGNAWNYTWFVPHDISGLIKFFGNDKEFSNKLYESFTTRQFTINNEPDIAYPYLFRYVRGEEHRTEELVHKIMYESFGTDHNGLPGNDDCGTISAWFIFSAMGFYPDCPAQGYYTLGYPLFNKVAIKLNPKYYSGTNFTIVKNRGNRKYGVALNGIKLINYRLYQTQVGAGGELQFK